MSKQTIYSIIALVVILGGIVIFSRPKPVNTDQALVSNEQTGTSTLTAVETEYDFGLISMAKGEVKKDFTLTNSGSAPLEIKRIETSCMCTTAYLVNGSKRLGPFGMPGHGGPSRSVKEMIQPGESRTLEVIFDPNTHGPAGVGPISRVVAVMDSTGKVTEFSFKANVTP